jgi:UDP-hydrolysing UDP-N-acetyl-D-glucosamine 2-epimerase
MTINPEQSNSPLRVAVVTGSRADFGLLTPVMHAVDAHPDLELLVIAAGSHLISPATTFRDVKALFPVADSIPMQTAGRTGRFADVEALGKGITRFGRSFEGHEPDWVVVLGDRVEAFAAASAASVAGIAVAHIHGGDRAEGVADEAMRHAITKLAHLHLAATETSAERIRKMGERPEHVILAGSPAIDNLDRVEPLPDDSWQDLGSPTALFLMHPTDRPEPDANAARSALEALGDARVLALAPNHDPGREAILKVLADRSGQLTLLEHMPRPTFLSLLKRLADSGGIMVGNSSAALIEAAALGLPAINLGPRQTGREKPATVIDANDTKPAIIEALAKARTITPAPHPYGDGRAGPCIADALAATNPQNPGLLRKQISY